MVDTKKFFNLLYPNFDKNKNRIDILVLDKNYKPVIEHRKLCQTIREVTKHIEKVNALRQYNIYFRCAVLKENARQGTKANIAYFNFIFADLDAKEISKDVLLQRIENFKVRPSIIVDSGNGYHIYFLLKTPVYDLLTVQKLLQSITKELGADPNCAKLTQVLRVPATFNLKSEPPKEVKIVRINNIRYNFNDLVDIFLSENCNETYNSSDNCSQVDNNATGQVNNNTTDRIVFDFASPPQPANITIDSFPELLDYLKKQNIFLGSNAPDFPLGKTFKCVLTPHPDLHPSANVFKTKDGYYYYKCFGCGKLYDIIGLYQEVKKRNFSQTIDDLSKFFGINFKYSHWIITQWQKYYENSIFIEHFAELKYDEIYPNLYKILKPRLKYLSLINHYGLSKISSEKYIYNNENLFFVSYRYFAQKYGISVTTATRNINLFAVLGLLQKVPLDEINQEIAQKALSEAKGKDVLKTVNFYIIPRFWDVAEKAERIAKTLLDNKFCITKCMNKFYLIKIFGQKFADSVYNDERVISKRSQTIAKRLETTLLKLIKEQGYATKDQVISKTILSGRLKATREDKEREFYRSLPSFLERNSLKCITATKKLVTKFNLKGYIKIIVPKDEE